MEKMLQSLLAGMGIDANVVKGQLQTMLAEFQTMRAKIDAIAEKIGVEDKTDAMH